MYTTVATAFLVGSIGYVLTKTYSARMRLIERKKMGLVSKPRFIPSTHLVIFIKSL